MKKRIAIVGGGVEGKSTYRYFAAQPDSEIFVHDQNSVEQSDFITATLVTGPHYLDNLEKYDLVVHSPGIRADKLGVSASKITTSTNEFFRQCTAQIIGVTGTKGKGTTSSLIAQFLEADGKTVHLLGNIGQPALDELNQIKPADWVVFELSSFQLSDLKQSPHIAVHLMLEPDHLDVHLDMAEYTAAKANIFAFQKPQDIAVYYAGSKAVTESAQTSRADTKIPYDRNGEFTDGAFVQKGLIMFGSHEIARVSDVTLVGEHMLDNVCAAVAAAYNQISDKTIYGKILKSFAGLPHRLQVVTEKNGVTYIDDSISTNPSTAIAAIKAFDQPKLLILGGSDKGNDFDSLAEVISKQNVKKVYLLGEMASKIAAAIEKAHYKNFVECSDLADIVKRTKTDAQSGDVVLLSPACASFDMFGGYAERGDEFTQLVSNL